jgi:nicotinamide mononucleotide transporter
MSVNLIIEILATLFSTLGVWLAAKNKLMTWPLGMIGVAFLGYLFFQSQLFAEAGLQVFYLGMSLYGWWQWLRLGHHAQSNHYYNIPKIKFTIAVLIWIFSTVLLGYSLQNQTSTDLPYPDAAMACAGLIITWMMAQKYIQHWLCWIMIDLSNIGIFIYKELYITAVLYFIFAILAVYGYMNWKKTMQQR